MFQVLSDVGHVLQRPAMYVGHEYGVRRVPAFMLSDGLVERRDADLDAIALKCFDEVLVNAADCAERTGRATYIEVSLDEKGFEVRNDGCDIPVEYNAEWCSYVPETLFGTLRSSCNYDDTRERHGAGVNGIGCKLANIFAARLTVEVTDATTHYQQTFTSNMREREAPEIAPIGARAPHTIRVAVAPDAARVSWSDDVRAVCARRAYDIALCTAVRVLLRRGDGELVHLQPDLSRYAPWCAEPLDLSMPAYRVLIGPSATPVTVSLANGTFTAMHGAHVAACLRRIHDALGGGTEAQWRRFVEDRAFVLVIARLDRPAFAGNEKTTVRAPLRPEPKLDRAHERALRAAPIAHAWAAWLSEQAQTSLARDERKRGARVRVDKLDDAALAGTAAWDKCTLILTEGDSAKSFAVAGVSVLGREKFGIFPLRGKVRNVRDATAVQTDTNAELRAVKTILNLRTGVAPDKQQLRYGTVLIMTDQDVDGFHIKGLIMNFLDAQFPGIVGALRLAAMSTPLIKATFGGERREFFTTAEFRAACAAAGAPAGVKYYKGLGTSTPDEARAYFAELERYTTTYTPEGMDRLAAFFARESVGSRKDAIRGAMERPEAARAGVHKTQTVGEFVATELTTYSVDAVHRAIPSVVDGLKPSQRKVLWCALRGKRGETKVAQLASYIAHETSYHHGEASLQQTIVAMAQDFVGSNNVPLLRPIGQFGTRRMGGTDAASARYIFTALSPVAALAFPAADTQLLPQLEEDGQLIEPAYLAPVVPWILVNGAMGIATGFSTNVPMHDARDVCARTREYIVHRTQTLALEMRVRGYTGVVARESGRYTTSASVQYAAGVATVTELPVGVWTEAYQAKLEDLLDEKVVTKYKNQSTDTAVRFTVHTATPKRLALSKHVPTGNMHALDADGALRKWETVEEIVEYFCALRLPMYERRKAAVARQLEEDIARKESTLRFISLVLSGGAAAIFDRPDACEALRERGFRDDVLDTPLRACTHERRARLERELATLRATLAEHEATAAVDTWVREIDALAAACPVP
jgi:DNA topoisomerase-2